MVIPFIPSDPEDMSVCEVIEKLKPDYFCKGGDRDLSNIPEVDVCKAVGAEIITGCGDDKYWSSSNFIRDHNNWMYTQMGL
jgi:bifunctional ADP-heptose synthase (sugar kinase/adenylyltransferase)